MFSPFFWSIFSESACFLGQKSQFRFEKFFNSRFQVFLNIFFFKFLSFKVCVFVIDVSFSSTESSYITRSIFSLNLEN